MNLPKDLLDIDSIIKVWRAHKDGDGSTLPPIYIDMLCNKIETLQSQIDDLNSVVYTLERDLDRNL